MSRRVALCAAAALPLACATKSAPDPDADYLIARAARPIRVDGRDDDRDWKKAAMSPRFRPVLGGPPIEGETRARLLWDDDHLYVFVKVEDRDVFSRYRVHDDPLWKEDCIELFIDADGNQRGYIELQVNPNNAQFDAWFPTGRGGRGVEGPRLDWQAGMKSAVLVGGTTLDRSDRDVGWSVEMALPLAAVRGMDPAMKVKIPPRPGDRWRLNLVRVDSPQGSGLVASAWSLIPVSDFHALDRLLVVAFADERGQVWEEKVP